MAAVLVALAVLAVLVSAVAAAGLTLAWQRAKQRRREIVEHFAAHTERLDRRSDLLQAQIDQLRTMAELDHLHRLLDDLGERQLLDRPRIESVRDQLHDWRREAEQ